MTGRLILLALFLASCSAKLVHAPEWKLHSVHINQIDESGALLEINVYIRNPNPFPIVVEEVRYQLSVGGAVLASGEKKGRFEFRPYQEAGISLPWKSDLAMIIRQIPLLKSQEIASYRLEGSVTAVFGGMRKTMPFEKSARLELPLRSKEKVKGPEQEGQTEGHPKLP